MCLRTNKILTEYLFVFLGAVFVVKSYGSFINYTENTELIQQRAGYDIKLQCGLKGLVDDNKIADVKIHWFFKQCSDNLAVSANNCHEFYEDDWTQLPCEDHFCKPDLMLRNVTEKYSGLYKCRIYPYRLDAGQTLDIQLVRTYQLDVKNISLAVPEFLESYPTNKTAYIGTQVVFQCRVYSEVHPTIKWFRRISEQIGDGAVAATDMVRYNGRTYELLATDREKYIGDDIYLSKLKLNGVRLQDESYYACVAISFRGHKIREAYLQVEEPEYWQDYETEDEINRKDPLEFCLLFLMPLGLAMLPVSVWLCYLIYKRCKRGSQLNSEDSQYSDEEMAADHCMLRT